MHFNPLPPHGGRLCLQATPRPCRAFQSTPSAWRETETKYIIVNVFLEFQSTPSAWRETHNVFRTPSIRQISIHSLRMEGDGKIEFTIQMQYISIHSLRMEGDNNFTIRSSPFFAFQSTPSAWRETCYILPLYFQAVISIHSLRMEGDPFRFRQQFRRSHFNPLPPHGGRLLFPEITVVTVVFQSTPSAWRETDSLHVTIAGLPISIHSLRMEGDAII